MKIAKYLSIGGLALAMTACFDEPKGESTAHLPGQGGDEPDVPTDITSPTPNFPVTAQAMTLSPSTTYQEMEGFAASDCWLGNWIGQYWSQGRTEIARMLFSQQIRGGQPQGIGLSMWRVNLGGGSFEQGADSKIVNVTNRAESYMDASGVYDWNKCAGQRYFMQQAKQYGTEKFVFFSNSPLVQFTQNGLATKIGMNNGLHSNLKDDSYGAFAEYMATVAEHFTEEGYNISHISPLNEPQYAWDGDNQEGSSWFNSEVAKLARELDKSLSSRGLNTNILIGEAGSFTSLYSGNNNTENVIDNLFNPSGSNYIGDLTHVDNLVCGHSYWTNNTWSDMRNVRSNLANKATQRNVRVWQTEWSLLGDVPQDLATYDDQFDNALYMSRVIHCDLAVAGVSSWSYWTAMSVERYSQQNRFELIFTTPAGGQYSDDTWDQNGTVQANANLWVLGNYSLFIRPGFKRIDLKLTETPDFFGTAWISPEGDRIVVVCTNYDKTNGMTLNLNGLPSTPKLVHRYTTTESKNMQQDYFKVGDDVFVEPHSVTTVVYDF